MLVVEVRPKAVAFRELYKALKEFAVHWRLEALEEEANRELRVLVEVASKRLAIWQKYEARLESR